MRLRLALFACVFLLFVPSRLLRAQETSAAEPRLVALLPETLIQKNDRLSDHRHKTGGALAERLQIELARDTRWAFVERASLAAIEDEQSLAASFAHSVRLARLRRAEWLLTLRLDARAAGAPMLVAEVFDAARAELLDRQSFPLDDIPDESWLVSPSDLAVASAHTAATRALAAASARAHSLRDRTTVLPLASINRAKTGRLAPFGPLLSKALARHATNADHGIHLLDHADSGDVLDESLLVRAGMTDTRPEDWARIADVFLWVEFFEETAVNSSRSTLVAQVLLIAGHDRRELLRASGDPAALPEFAERVAAATLAAVRGLRTELAPEDRRLAAARLQQAARDLAPRASAHSSPENREDFIQAFRWIGVAAFLSPEDPRLGELRVRMGLALARDPGALAHWESEYWSMVDRSLNDADNRIDLGLLARSGSVPLLTAPGATDRLLRIAGQLRGRRLPGDVDLGPFARRWIAEILRERSVARRRELFEALWQIMRPHLDDTARDTVLILWEIYGNDTDAGRAFLASPAPIPEADLAFHVSADPWADFFQRSAPGRKNLPVPRPSSAVAETRLRASAFASKRAKEPPFTGSPDQELQHRAQRESGSLLLADIARLLDAGADPLWRDPSASGHAPTALERLLKRGEFAAAEAVIVRLAPARLNEPDSDQKRHAGRTAGIVLLRAVLQARQSDLATLLLQQSLRLTPAEDAYAHADHSSDLPALTVLAVEAQNPPLVRALRQAGFFVPLNAAGTRVRDEIVRLQDPELLRAILEPVGGAKDDRRHDDAIPHELSRRYSPSLLADSLRTGWWEGVDILVAAGAERLGWDNRDQVTFSSRLRPHPELAVRYNRRPDSPDNTLEGATALADLAVHRRPLDDARLTPVALRHRDHDGETLLHAAIRVGDTDTARRILDASRRQPVPLDLDAQTKPMFETPLLLAIQSDNLAIATALLDAGASPDGPRDAEGVTPLVFAALQNRPALVRLLLDHGADPNRPAADHTTPLHAAALVAGDDVILRTLVSIAGIQMNVVNHDGHGLLEAAVISDSPEKIQWLIDRGVTWHKPWPTNYHPLLTASRRGLTGSVRKLLELGLTHPSALSIARDDATRAVLQSAPGDDARNMRRNEALWPDILKGEPGWRERADAFLADGGDVDHPSSDWGCPLLLVTTRERLECLEYLVAHGADTSVRHGSYMTRPEGDTLLNVWFKRRRGVIDGLTRDDRERDQLALRYIEIFWKHETDAEEKSELVEGALERRLPLAAARLIELGAPSDDARRMLEKYSYSPEDRARWRAILGAPARTP